MTCGFYFFLLPFAFRLCREFRVHHHDKSLARIFRQRPKPVDISSFLWRRNVAFSWISAAREGDFCCEWPNHSPTWNFLGVEIRDTLVIEANEIAKEQNLDNVHYVFLQCNDLARPTTC
jgi:tRNA (guanine-N7-)-methyltransferase